MPVYKPDLRNVIAQAQEVLYVRAPFGGVGGISVDINESISGIAIDPWSDVDQATLQIRRPGTGGEVVEFRGLGKNAYQIQQLAELLGDGSLSVFVPYPNIVDFTSTALPVGLSSVPALGLLLYLRPPAFPPNARNAYDQVFADDLVPANLRTLFLAPAFGRKLFLVSVFGGVGDTVEVIGRWYRSPAEFFDTVLATAVVPASGLLTLPPIENQLFHAVKVTINNNVLNISLRARLRMED